MTKMRIKDHWTLSDRQLEDQFAKRTLKPLMFSHEAHLRLAFIHLQKYGLSEARRNMCEQIKAFAEAHGHVNKFNKTVTIAAVEIVHQLMLGGWPREFKSFIVEHPRLLSHFRKLLSEHYSFDIFKSDQARKQYLPPDLQPF